MNDSLSPYEKKIFKEQHSLCNASVKKKDLIYSFPGSCLTEAHADIVAERLQGAIDYLKDVIKLDPTQKLRSRCVIRWKKDREATGDPGWSSDEDANGNFFGHWIDLTWDYMLKPCEPFRACAHELVHPFYRISPLHKKDDSCIGYKDWLGNEGWGEGFCDFIRGPVMNQMKLPGHQGTELWQHRISNAQEKKNDKGGNAAGQFVIWFLEEFCESDENSVAEYIANKQLIRSFVGYLFDNFACRPLKRKLSPTHMMKNTYGSKKL